MTPIERVRAHAAKIRNLLASKSLKEEAKQVRIWRALYYIDEYQESVRAAAIIQGKDQPILVQYQIPAAVAIPTWGTVIQLSGAYVSAEEIAVFLGLAHVEPEDLTWTLTWAE